MTHQWYDVTASTQDPVPFPTIVAALEHAGCRILGRIAPDPERVELDPRLREVFSSETIEAAQAEAKRPATVALASPGGDAFVALDEVDHAPRLRLRTILDGGDLVETTCFTRQWTDENLGPEALERLRNAPGRSVRVLVDAGAGEVVCAHRDHLANYRLTHHAEVLRHDRIDVMVELWTQVARHDDALDKHVDMVATGTRAKAGMVATYAGGPVLLAIGVVRSELLLAAFGLVAAVGAPVALRHWTRLALRSSRRRPRFRFSPAGAMR